MIDDKLPEDIYNSPRKSRLIIRFNRLRSYVNGLKWPATIVFTLSSGLFLSWGLGAALIGAGITAMIFTVLDRG